MKEKIKPKRKAGRPKKEIDYRLAGKLAHIQCTQSEIASILDVSLAKLEHDKEFLRIFEAKKKSGKSSLRRMQFGAAEQGNTTLLIWLGKQYLGQTDQQNIRHEGSVELIISKDQKGI